MQKYIEDIEMTVLEEVARKMAAAAKTAPKASGVDDIMIAIVTGEEKDRIADKMMELGIQYDEEFIRRDADQLRGCKIAVLFGLKETPFGLPNCSFCGFKNCAYMKNAGGQCALGITDLGIAIGSAASIAADNRIDNRVMYSIGKALSELNDVFPESAHVCYGIPLSISSKSIFFDRGPGAVLR